MARKKRKRNDLLDDLSIPIGFSLAGATTSVLGGAFQPIIPAGIANPLTAAGSTLGQFSGPVSAVAGAGIVIKQVRKIKKKRRKR